MTGDARRFLSSLINLEESKSLEKLEPVDSKQETDFFSKYNHSNSIRLRQPPTLRFLIVKNSSPEFCDLSDSNIENVTKLVVLGCINNHFYELKEEFACKEARSAWITQDTITDAIIIVLSSKTFKSFFHKHTYLG